MILPMLGCRLGDGVMVGPGVLEFVGEIGDLDRLPRACRFADEGIQSSGTETGDEPDDFVHGGEFSLDGGGVAAAWRGWMHSLGGADGRLAVWIRCGLDGLWGLE